jgi:hypothetical protein
MMQLTGIPAQIVEEGSPDVYSYLVATESPVLFTFRHTDGNISDVTDAATSPDAIVITHDAAGYAPEVGSQVSIYDALLDAVAVYEVSAVNSATEFEVFGEFESRFATDWTYFFVLDKANVYLEMRLKCNGVYESYTLRFSPNTKGIVSADISQVLKSKVNGTKLGNYTSDYDIEYNQSGNFNVEYRERYAGDSNDWTVETNTWYYVYAIRSKEQGSNLGEFWDTVEVDKPFNLFNNPTWWVGNPFDIQVWCNPIYFASPYAGIQVRLIKRDAAGISLGIINYDVTDAGAAGRLVSIRIDQDSIEETCDKITVNLRSIGV